MAVPTGASRTTVSNLFKKQYRDEKIHQQINTKAPFYQRLKKRAVAVTEGEDFTDFLLTELSDAGRDFAEWDDLAQPDNVKNLKAVYNMTYYNRTVRASGRAIEAGGGAAVGPLIQEIRRMSTAMFRDFEKSPFMKSTGAMAAISSVTDSTTVVVDTFQLLNVGMYVGVLVASTGAVGNGVEKSKITAITVDKATGKGTLTLETALGNQASVDTTYSIFRSKSYNISPWGFPDIISSSNPTGGNLGGLDRTVAANADWKSNEEDAENRPISGELVAHILEEVDMASGMIPGLIVCHPYVLLDLIAQLKKDSRIEQSKMNFEAFGTSVTVNNVPVMKHRYCLFSDMWFINEPTFEIAYPKGRKADGGWIKAHSDHGDFLERVPGKWAYQAAWVTGRQRICTMPVANARLKNIKWARFGTTA